MRTLALTVAYDGTDWAGFQRQTQCPSVQDALEAALAGVLGHPVRVGAAGRTDAGVHALGQVVSLPTTNPIPLERVAYAVNRQLPASIRIRRATECVEGFHARWSARSRRYAYCIQPTSRPDPLRGRFCWQVRGSLDADAMAGELAAITGTHDFAAFRHDAQPDETTVRTVERAVLRRTGPCWVLDLQANAFLHRMVRLIAANLVAVGQGARPATWLAELLASRDRHMAGLAAPPCGLVLMRIGYPPAGAGGAVLGETCNEELPG